MKVSRWIFIIAGVVCFTQSAPILFSLISNGSSVLPDQAILRGFIVFSLILYLLWVLVYFLISSAPSQYRLFIVPSIAAIITSTFLPVWVYFYGVGPWKLLRPISYLLALLFGVAFLLELRQAKQTAA